MKTMLLVFVLLIVGIIGLLPTGAAAKDGPIGLSLKQLAQGGLESIPMPPAHPVHGQPRLSGISDDKLILFEVVGDPRNVSVVTILAFMPGDDLAKRTEGLAGISRLMENASPGWHGAFAWLMKAFQRAQKSPDTSIVAIRGNRRYEVFYNRELSNLMLTVKHK